MAGGEREKSDFDGEGQALVDRINNAQDRFRGQRVCLGMEMATAVQDLAGQLYELNPNSFRIRRTIMDGRPYREPLIRMGKPGEEISEGESCLGLFISAERGMLCFSEALQHGRRVIVGECSLPGPLEVLATDALNNLNSVASGVKQSV